jgi:hypothetical protein
MPIRTVLALVLATALFALPSGAEAGGKGPMWLTMSGDGQLLTVSGPRVVQAVPPSNRPKGTYEITFYRDLTGCAATGTTNEGWVATVGVAVASPDPTEITVHVMNPLTGALVDLPFTAVVMCPK